VGCHGEQVPVKILPLSTTVECHGEKSSLVLYGGGAILAKDCKKFQTDE